MIDERIIDVVRGQGQRARPTGVKEDTMATGITRKAALEFAIAHIGEDNAEVTAKLAAMLEQLNKPRKAGVKRETAAHKANAALVEKLVEVAPKDEAFDGAYVREKLELDTPQKATAVMKLACEMGYFERVKEGKKVTYTYIPED